MYRGNKRKTRELTRAFPRRSDEPASRASIRKRKPIEIPLPLLRATYLKAAKIKHYELAEMVFARFGGERLSRAAISAVLAGDFRNAAVIDVFCEITGTDPQVMFPQEAKNAAAS